MKTIKVPGDHKEHGVLVYALSTCIWCKKAKQFLRDKKVEYEYVDVDHCSREDREEIRRHILEKGGRLSYPAIIIDNKLVVNGVHEDKIIEALEI